MAKQSWFHPVKTGIHSRRVRAPRRLVIEGLEGRDLMAVLFANHLDDVRLEANGVSVNPPNQLPDLSGYVLIVQGAKKNDSISIRPSASSPGAVECTLNGVRSVHAGTIDKIIVHGQKGNDTIAIDPSLLVDTMLFGGEGNDTVTGGGGDDVIVGGTGSNVLAGGPGRDVLFGGSGADRLYGKAQRATGESDQENLLFANLFAQDHNLSVLRDLATQWFGDASRAERESAVKQIFGTGLAADKSTDKSYAAGDADWVLSAGSTRDETWLGVPGISGAWFSSPVRDANGFDVYRVQSEYQKSETSIRVLLPSGFQKDRQYPVVYVLPVEAGTKTTYGDGLITVKKLALQTQHEAIFVAPSFSAVPWYADHATTRQIWQETHFSSVVVPLIETRYPAIAAPDGRLLLGFSKSGYGAFTMLLRHPEKFGRAFAFDSPLASTGYTSWGFNTVLGSKANFENYRVSSLLSQRAAELGAQPPRLFMLGYNMFRADQQTIHNQMVQLGIPHVYDPGVNRAHRWDSGWVGQAVDMLLS